MKTPNAGCRSPTPPESPSKRLKTLIQTLTPAPPPSLKGKEKLPLPSPPLDDPNPNPTGICGICLSEDGRSIRGKIDSCDHFFCFVCIMEWSKVESWCPMCKRPFGSIRRPPVSGVFRHERVVRVPVRDQVERHGRAAPVDPYAEITCTECQSNADENLLLLCDLCDSAAHTYCVGLGATVPEGDWYCYDCAIIRDEHSKIDPEEDNCPQNSCNVFNGHHADSLPVSIFDIVSDEGSGIEPSGNSRETQNNVVSCNEEPSVPGTIASEHAARTLRRCRDVNSCMQRLRENWDALRNGSLSFSAGLFDTGQKASNQKQQSRGLNPNGASNNSKLLDKIENGSGDSVCGTSSQDVDRAWKMMQAAKSCKTPTNRQIQTCSVEKYCLEKKREVKLGLPIPKRKSPDRRFPKSAPEEGSGQPHFRTQNNEKLKRDDITTVKKGPQNQNKSFDNHLLRNCKLSGGHLSRSSDNLIPRKQELPSHQVLSTVSEHANRPDMPHSTSVASTSQGFSALSTVKAKHREQLEFVRKSPRMKVFEDKNVDGSSSSIFNDAKSEIQSLVKLNLKLQCTGQRLGTDRFKEAARTATHTILAACGLEHSKSRVRPFPSLVCSHSEQLQKVHRSNIMPNSCRQCFYNFVKDVVNGVISEKVAPADCN